MSFDILFCRQQGQSCDLNLPALRLHLGTTPNVSEVQSDAGQLVQFEYKNEATGVYFFLDLTTYGDVTDEPVLPAGYIDMGLSAVINFLRPSFFALEAMPVIADIGKALDLLFYDPQADAIFSPETAQHDLIASWTAHNDAAVRAVSHDQEPIRKPFLPREKAVVWWEYARKRSAYQDQLGDDIFVPSIWLAVDEGQRVRRVAMWVVDYLPGAEVTGHITFPHVIPPCEDLLLVSTYEGESVGYVLVPFSEAETMLSVVTEDIPGPVEGLRLIPKEQQSAASMVFSRLLSNRAAEEGIGSLEVIAPDGFVDVWVD